MEEDTEGKVKEPSKRPRLERRGGREDLTDRTGEGALRGGTWGVPVSLGRGAAGAPVLGSVYLPEEMVRRGCTTRLEMYRWSLSVQVVVGYTGSKGDGSWVCTRRSEVF